MKKYLPLLINLFGFPGAGTLLIPGRRIIGTIQMILSLAAIVWFTSTSLQGINETLEAYKNIRTQVAQGIPPNWSAQESFLPVLYPTIALTLLYLWAAISSYKPYDSRR